MGVVYASCPQGHFLIKFQPGRNGFSCDRCGDRASPSDTLYGCRPCNYDLCETCCHPKNESKSDSDSDDTHELQICISGLDQSKDCVIQIQKAEDINRVLSICGTLQTNIDSVALQLVKTQKTMEITKDNTDTKLANNRTAYAEVQSDISDKKEEIDNLTTKLTGLESDLDGYRDQIREQEADLRRKKREKKAAEERAVAIGITAGVASLFTFGIAGVAAAAAIATPLLVNDVNSIQSKISSLNSSKYWTQQRLNETKSAISNGESEMSRFKSQKSRLISEKERLDTKSKKLGQKIVDLKNCIKQTEMAQIKCSSLVTVIDTVKDLAEIDCLDCIEDPTRDLLTFINGAQTDLKKVT